MWEILIFVCTYFIFCGITFKIMLTFRGYKKYSEVPAQEEDAPLIVFGTIFWPVTLLMLLGIFIARFILTRLKAL
jgi:hypothetical protein